MMHEFSHVLVHVTVQRQSNSSHHSGHCHPKFSFFFTRLCVIKSTVWLGVGFFISGTEAYHTIMHTTLESLTKHHVMSVLLLGKEL